MNNIYHGQPYTYVIRWTAINRQYYGVRYAKGCHPTDLWKTYFTSSKKVKKLRKEYGEPDIIQIRKIFVDPLAAQIWEFKVLNRLRVNKKSHWLNQNQGKAREWTSGPNHQNYGMIVSPSTRVLQSIRRQKRKWWNNGIIQIHCENPPSDDFIRGRLHFNNVGSAVGSSLQRGKIWINNIISEMMIENNQVLPPGHVLGRIVGKKTKGLPKKKLGYKWWTNDIVSKFSIDPPGVGWRLGRTQSCP